jgi:hypothetical protein
VAVPQTFVLYRGASWAVDYDWRAYAREHPGEVPSFIIDLTERGRAR